MADGGDLSRYLAFAGAISPCFVGGCQPETIRGFFESYMKDSESLMLAQVKSLLAPWASGVTSVDTKCSSLSKNINSLGSMTTSIQADATKIINSLCPNPAICANNSLTDFKTQRKSNVRILLIFLS
jgi:hypothetical protein